MKYFGPAPWGPAADGDVPMVPTPTGSVCSWCEETVEDGDSGVLMPLITIESEDKPAVREIVQHKECFLRSMFGSVGHLRKACSCYGGDEEDPPHMTKRQAAAAAVQLFHAQQQGTPAPSRVPAEIPATKKRYLN